MTNTETTTSTRTVTLTETGTPSRSKGRGWCRIAGIDDFFATPSGHRIEVDAETITVIIGTEIRRATRTEKDRASHVLTVTGNPADHVDLTLSSPQSYDVRITGVTR